MNIHLYDMFDARTIETLNQIHNTIPPVGKQSLVRRTEHVLSLVEPIVKKDLPFIGRFLSGSSFTYTHPNLPHCDHISSYGDTLTVIIPLFNTDDKTCLMLWEQKWNQTQTWDMAGDSTYYPTENEFSKDVALPGFPGDYQLNGHTLQDVSENVVEYVANKHAYFGMSGNALPFLPGSIIMFNSRYINNMGHFAGKVKGLTLRFHIENNDKEKINTN